MLTLTGVRTQPFAGVSGTFRVSTRSSDGLESEVSADKTVSLVPREMLGVTVSP